MSNNNFQQLENEMELSDRDEDFFEDELPNQNINTGEKQLSVVSFYAKGLYNKSRHASLNPTLNQIKSENSLGDKQNLGLGSNNMLLTGNYGTSQNMNNELSLSEELREQSYISSYILNYILKKTDQLVYDRYIQRSLNDYGVTKSIQQIETSYKQAIFEPDDEYDLNTLIQDRQDIEPDLPYKETWIRSHAIVEQKLLQFPIQEEKHNSIIIETPKSVFTSKHGSTYYGGFKSTYKSIKKSRGNLSSQEKDRCAIKPNLPVNQEIQQEFDEYEERYRKIKMDEQKRKEMKEEQDKIQKQEQLKVKTELKKELKSKFTFDFDGRIITQKVIKSEKLPPSYHTMNYHMKEQEIAQIKKGFEKDSHPTYIDNVKLQKTLAGQQDKNQNNVSNVSRKSLSVVGLENQLNKIQMPTKLPYNEFNPTYGVTLFYNQQVKEGPRHQESIETLEDLEQKLKLLQPKEPMQITRSEYQRLTEKGNLVANFMKSGDKIQNTNSILKDLEVSQSGLFKTTFGKIYEEPQSSHFGISVSKTQGNFRKYNQNNKINVNSNKLIKNLAIDKEDEEQYEERLKINLKKQQIESQIKKQQTPNDEFNLRLINSPDWGKQKGSAYFPTIPNNQKQNLKSMQQTLNTIYKLPRERDQGQGLKLSKALYSTTQSQTFFSHKINKTRQNSIESIKDREDYENINNIKLKNPYNFRGTFNSTHTKFTDSLRTTTYT